MELVQPPPLQVPFEQVCPAGQQVVPHGVSPEAQLVTQVSFEQVCVDEQHATPPHGVVPEEQVIQEPSEQIVPAGQHVLVVPLSQNVCPGAHAQVPFVHDWPQGQHMVPHASPVPEQSRHWDVGVWHSGNNDRPRFWSTQMLPKGFRSDKDDTVAVRQVTSAHTRLVPFKVEGLDISEGVQVPEPMQAATSTLSN